MKFKTTLFSIVISATCVCLSQAANLQILNEAKKEFSIKIESETNPSHHVVEKIAPESASSISVVEHQLGGGQYFSIKGVKSPFVPGGKCEHLSADRDYRVTFENDKTGMVCIAEEK